MLLSRLLAEAGIDATLTADPEVTSVAYDSRKVTPGVVFVAVPGFHVDGHDHVPAAVASGARAVVALRTLDVTVPVVIVPDTRVALAALAAVFAGHPSHQLTVAGVTGTDGKTTTATMLWAAWRGAGLRAGCLTTVDWRIAEEIRVNSTRQTTLEAVEVQAQLSEIRDAGCTHAVLETSSHALELHRVDGIDYRIAVYTRITSEHLDLHGSREEYVAAKLRLAQMVASRSAGGVVVADADDAETLARLQEIAGDRLLRYGLDDPSADLHAETVRSDAAGIRFRARTPWGDADVALQLAGRYNAANALAALGAACSSGAALDGAVAGLQKLSRVHGRMERVDCGQPFAVVIDYAHTADALEKVLRELRPATTGRLYVVFGSAGERDREKRPVMGGVAVRGADTVVITDEDPRDEDRLQILEEIAAGAVAAGGVRGGDVHLIPDRTEAIAWAIDQAQPGDTVLCAGKGHESSLLVAGGRSLPWDERAVATEALRARGFSA